MNDPEASKWADRIIAALVGADACYADKSAFIHSDCNIFVGRVLEHAYDIKDFVLQQPKDGLRYETSNAVALLLLLKPGDNWVDLGALTDQKALTEAQRSAGEGKAVIAVWSNPDPKKPGHVALIGPGPLTKSGSLKLDTPVSASFFQGKPDQNYIGKPLACAFTSSQARSVRIFSRK